MSAQNNSLLQQIYTNTTFQREEHKAGLVVSILVHMDGHGRAAAQAEGHIKACHSLGFTSFRNIRVPIPLCHENDQLLTAELPGCQWHCLVPPLACHALKVCGTEMQRGGHGMIPQTCAACS